MCEKNMLTYEKSMRIAFIESFLKTEWNGYIARYTQGVSGTHATIFYLAEAIAKKNHHVSVIQTNAVFESKWVNNVFYQSMENLVTENEIYDVIVCTFQLEDMKVLSKIKKYNKIAFVMNCIELFKHNDYQYTNFIKDYDHSKTVIFYVSENCKHNVFFRTRQMENIRHHLLYNSIDIRDFVNSKGELYTFPEEKKENNFVFFACPERGLKIVIEVVKKLNKKYNVVVSNYNKTDYLHVENVNLIKTENTSKQCILNWNRKSKYFIYPCVNADNNYVHYDTFGYVVLEALLCGVIVIAPRMRVFEELYGDAICYVETNDLIHPDELKLSHWLQTSTNMIWDKLIPIMGMPLVERYVNVINKLENDPELRRTHISRGFSLKNKFSNEIAADSFLNFFSHA